MLPFQKLASLFIRTFSKPISNQIKRYAINQHRARKKSFIKFLFIKIGNSSNKLENYLNRRSMGINNQQMFIKPLTDEAALNKGADVFADLFIYFCVLGIPIFEIYKVTKDSEKKQNDYNGKIESFQNSLKELKKIHSYYQEQHNYLLELNNILKQQITKANTELIQQIEFVDHLQNK